MNVYCPECEQACPAEAGKCSRCGYPLKPLASTRIKIAARNLYQRPPKLLIGLTAIVVLAATIAYSLRAGGLLYSPPTTITEACKALESKGWRFRPDKTFGGEGVLPRLRLIIYEKDTLSDYSMTTNIREDFERPGGFVWGYTFEVRGPGTDTTPNCFFLSYIKTALRVLAPDCIEAVERAIATEKPIDDNGLRRDQGVVTSKNGWRVTVIQFTDYFPAKGNDNAVLTVMLRRM